jgi:antitoxin (DNA-binding transcriptional repressor) of toxin-antitoxin stability system
MICVNSCVVKTASVYEVQHNFSRVLSWVDSGETVIIKRRNIPVAKLVPTGKKKPALPDFMRRLEKNYGKQMLPDSGPILDELRDDRI